MKYFLMMMLSLSVLNGFSQSDSAPTLKSVLLEQLKTTHTVKDWFVPANIAVAGLTAEQANWKDKSDNHSHCHADHAFNFLDQNNHSINSMGKSRIHSVAITKKPLRRLPKKPGPAAVKELDEVLSQLEQAVQRADETQLKTFYSTLAHIGTHNAYHVGQIIYIRKMKGWWKEENGVK